MPVRRCHKHQEDSWWALQEAAALQRLLLFNIFIHKPDLGTDSALMKFTDGTHLGAIMNTRNIREMIQRT